MYDLDERELLAKLGMVKRLQLATLAAMDQMEASQLATIDSQARMIRCSACPLGFSKCGGDPNGDCTYANPCGNR